MAGTQSKLKSAVGDLIDGPDIPGKHCGIVEAGVEHSCCKLWPLGDFAGEDERRKRRASAEMVDNADHVTTDGFGFPTLVCQILSWHRRAHENAEAKGSLDWVDVDADRLLLTAFVVMHQYGLPTA